MVNTKEHGGDDIGNDNVDGVMGPRERYHQYTDGSQQVQTPLGDTENLLILRRVCNNKQTFFTLYQAMDRESPDKKHTFEKIQA